jgi:hypothetical protein
VGGNSHAVKFGADWQGLESEAFFRYPTNNYFGVENFDTVTRLHTD